MGHRIHLAVFGAGLGHASRASLVAETLKKQGFIVNFSSFYSAVEYLRKMGFKCDRVKGIDVGWKEEGVSTVRTFMSIPILFSNFAQQVRQEIRIIDRFKPDIVISDSRLSAVFAAYLAGIPSVTISNQLRILLPPRFRSKYLKKVEGIFAELLGVFWALSDAIIVPDLPPPHTISERNTEGVRTVNGKVRYLGFMTPPSEVSVERISTVLNMLDLDKGKCVVFAHISGPPETKCIMVNSALEAAEALSDKFIFIISKGEVGGNDKPRRIKGGWFFDWCNIKDELLYIADILIIRGGHSSISQAIMHSKPVVTVPIRNHSEQFMNACKVTNMGFGVSVDPVLLTGRNLASAVEMVWREVSFREKACKLGKIAHNLNGVKCTVDTIKSLL